ncbi:MAG: elongation factor G, partial [Chloroflexi bacterium]|nr:elongation factor G [Chloroflexota bacterium]
RMQAYRGDKGREEAIPAEFQDAADEAREQLVEAVAETDDELTMKYLEGEELTSAEIAEGLRKGVRAGKIIPVLCSAALHNKTIPPVLNALVDYMPTPVDRPAAVAQNLRTDQEEKVTPRPDGPLAALVFKTSADPYVGKLSFFKIYSGTLRSDSRVFSVPTEEEERLGQLYTMRGKEQLPVAEFGPGDIGVVAKLTHTNTGDTLCDKDHLLRLPGIVFPRPVFAVAVQPKTKADTDKLSSGLNRLTEEDPTISVYREADTNELIISGMGESHVDVALERLHRKFGAEVTTAVPKVPYKETIRGTAQGQGRHKKQTGGRGQFGDVYVRLEPAERGSGFEFLDEVVGGSVPRNYIPAVEKGLREALKTGILAGFPMVDFKAALYDGSYHPVDSSDLAFQLAGIIAFKKVSEMAGPIILEPIVKVEVTVPEEYMGDVIGDLNSKRGRVLGMGSAAGFSTISAEVPQAEMQRYATDLRSMTQGRGVFTLEFNHYEEVPGNLVPAIVEQAKKEREESK